MAKRSCQCCRRCCLTAGQPSTSPITSTLRRHYVINIDMIFIILCAEIQNILVIDSQNLSVQYYTCIECNRDRGVIQAYSICSMHLWCFLLCIYTINKKNTYVLYNLKLVRTRNWQRTCKIKQRTWNVSSRLCNGQRPLSRNCSISFSNFFAVFFLCSHWILRLDLLLSLHLSLLFAVFLADHRHV